MKLSSRTSALLLAALVTLTAAPPAFAQTDNATDIAVAHQTLRIPGQTYPLGFNVDVSRAVASSWRLVGEFGMAHDSVSNAFDSGTLNLFQFGVGPRIGTTAGRVVPYAQLIAGGVHTNADLVHPVGPATDDSDWAFMLQPGVGVRIPIANAMGAMTQFDYRRAFFKEQGDNEWRFLVGAYFTFR